MDAKLFAEMINDKNISDLKKMQYKYGTGTVDEMLGIMKESFFTALPIKDFSGKPVVYLDAVTHVSIKTAKLLLTPLYSDTAYGIQAMEDEIHSSMQIEQIDSSREDIHRILNGYAPRSEDENRIAGMKKGLDFISDRRNKITEENLYRLYMMTVGDYLDGENRLLPGNYYRHDAVYVVGGKNSHKGISHEKLPQYMKEFVAFINADSGMNDLVKAALIHFYFAYLHPYFDGNGRTARFLHLWYLVQQGYSSALFVAFSSYINESKNGYYKAYRRIEDNSAISGVIDATPFLTYFTEKVYDRIENSAPAQAAGRDFTRVINDGLATEKEKALWGFVLSAYGTGEFSTKQLERDYGQAAYGTVRTFVMKFTGLGLLEKLNYSNRPKYRVK